MFVPVGRDPEHPQSGRRTMRSALLHTVVAALAMIAIVAPAHSRPATPLTLAAAEDLALVAEPGQLAIEARAAALDERAIVAGELPDPMLRVGLNNFPLESGGFSTEGMTQLMVGYRQAFPAGKTRSLSYEKFGLLSDQMSESANARGRSVRTATQKAWLELYFLDRAETLIRESRPFFADLAEITRSLYAVGRKTQQDVLRDRGLRKERRVDGRQGLTRVERGARIDRLDNDGHVTIVRDTLHRFTVDADNGRA